MRANKIKKGTFELKAEMSTEDRVIIQRAMETFMGWEPLTSIKDTDVRKLVRITRMKLRELSGSGLLTRAQFRSLFSVLCYDVPDHFLYRFAATGDPKFSTSQTSESLEGLLETLMSATLVGKQFMAGEASREDLETIEKGVRKLKADYQFSRRGTGGRFGTGIHGQIDSGTGYLDPFHGDGMKCFGKTIVPLPATLPFVNCTSRYR